MQKDKINNFDLIVVLLSLIMIFSIISRFSFSVSVQTVIFLLISISTLFLLNNFKISATSYVVPSVFLIAVSVISYINSGFQINARDYNIVLITSLLAGFNVTFLSMNARKKMFIVPVFIALWLSMILFSRFITNPQGFINGDDFYETIALNVNIIASFLVLVYPLIFIFIKDKSFSNFKIFIAMAVFVLIAIFLTRSRVAILTSLLVTLAFLFEYRKNVYSKVFMAIILVLLVSAVFYISLLKSNFNSLTERLIWWKTAYLIFREHLFFGCGFGNYAILFKTFRPELVLNTLYAHNIIMQILADLGIFGLISFVYLSLSFYKKVINEIRSNGGDKYFYKTVALSITSFLFLNLVDYGFFVPANMLAFFIIFCSVFFTESVKLKKERINSYFLTIMFVIFAVFVVKPVIANVYYGRGIDFYVAKQYAPASENFLKAIKFDRKNPEYYYQFANTQFAMFDQNRDEGKEYIENAIMYTKQAVEFNKYGSQLLASLAFLYLNKNDKENAVKYIEEAIKYDKFNPYFEEYYQKIRLS